MADSGKGKEKEIVDEQATSVPPHAPTFKSATASTVQEPIAAVSTPPSHEAPTIAPVPSDVPVLSNPTTEVPTATTSHADLPSETTEGPSASVQQINPHVSVVSYSNTFASVNRPRINHVQSINFCFPEFQQATNLTQDNTEDDTDSALGDDDQASETTSIASTIMNHRFENGRRYHKFREGEYWGPNDDIAHHMFLILLDQNLHLAPVKNPKNILDLGCGTGIWCMDMADRTSLLFAATPIP
jgi:hypothetical protein